MATGRFAPCPHCDCALSYLEGVTGSTMTPKCPRCGVPIGRRDMDAVAAEGERLLAFTDPDASRTVSVAHATKSTATSRRTPVATGTSRETVSRRTKKGD